ncbi:MULTISPECIES: DNA cytosine methyltransferase [unclassified Desulfovibrio]|uniref:DNA cytosine methyltransferase n=1 Tax=unclassified Desulfovibrio TaxID=2593640 RepID=UPI002FDAB24E
MSAYYNEIDPFAAAWLRELIKAGHIAPGEVDERSIADVMPSDLAGFTQCHFFAGIGVWSYALRNAGWSDDRQVWTGSCPCQPFSSAGKGMGFKDERHLWPEFYRLISQCRPTVCFGEQVASKDGLAWLDLVQADMENADYAFGAVDTCSASFGAPHIRQRLYWVADAKTDRLQGRVQRGPDTEREAVNGQAGRNGTIDRLANSISSGQLWSRGCSSTQEQRTAECCLLGRLADAEGGGWREKQQDDGRRDAGNGEGKTLLLAGNSSHHRPRPTNCFWRDADWLLCRDGKWRAVEPGTFPLAHGAAHRMGCVCSQCKTEAVVYEGMYFLRKVSDWNEGREQKEVLQQRVLSFAQTINAFNKQEHSALSCQRDEGFSLRNLQQYNQPTGSPQRLESVERFTTELTDPMLKMPPQDSLQRAAFCVRRLWEGIQSGITQEQEQDMFCPVCQRMGAHVCTEEVVKNRVGRLRGYGNAINAEQAKAFIEAFMETTKEHQPCQN